MTSTYIKYCNNFEIVFFIWRKESKKIIERQSF